MINSRIISILHGTNTVSRKNPRIVTSTPEALDEYKAKMNWISWDDKNSVSFEPITISIRTGLRVSGPESKKIPIESGDEIEIRGPYQQIERIAPIVQLWGYGYYHFLIEQMPKILRIAALSQDIPILTYCASFHASINTRFIPEILAAFGVKNPIVSYHPMVTYLVSEAILTTDIICGIPSRADLDMLRQLVVRPVVAKPIGILIKRSGRPLRTLANHDAILAALRGIRPDLEWRVFDSMTFIDTVRLFSEASVIVGPHGAGLANMVWCNEGTEIIEIGSAVEPNICYWHISELLGNKHTIVISDQDSEGRFTISPDKIVGLLTPPK